MFSHMWWLCTTEVAAMSKAVVSYHLTDSNCLQELQESWPATSDITSLTAEPKIHPAPGCGDCAKCTKWWSSERKQSCGFILIYFSFECRYYRDKTEVTTLCCAAPSWDFSNIWWPVSAVLHRQAKFTREERSDVSGNGGWVVLLRSPLRVCHPNSCFSVP